MPDYSVLKSEVLNDPTHAGYTGMNDGQVAASLNNPITVQGPIPMTDVVVWAAGNGVMGKLQSHASNSGDPFYSAALAMQAAINGGMPTLDVTQSGVMSLVNAFQAAGDFSAAQEATLLAYGQSQTSRAKQLQGWGVSVTANDIFFVRGS